MKGGECPLLAIIKDRNGGRPKLQTITDKKTVSTHKGYKAIRTFKEKEETGCTEFRPY